MDGILSHFSCPRGVKRHGNKNVFILQRFSDKFKLFVDITNVDEISDGDRLTIVQANSSSDATNGQKLISQASKLCNNMKRPPQKHTEAMAALFPSSSSTPKHPRLSNVFDPTLQCVAFHQKQKKKAARIKATKVTVMLVNSNANSVPRGKHRKALLENKSIEKLEI